MKKTTKVRDWRPDPSLKIEDEKRWGGRRLRVSLHLDAAKTMHHLAYTLTYYIYTDSYQLSSTKCVDDAKI